MMGVRDRVWLSVSSVSSDCVIALNNAHTSVKYTMEVEKNGKLPFLGTKLLNHAPRPGLKPSFIKSTITMNYYTIKAM